MHIAETWRVSNDQSRMAESKVASCSYSPGGAAICNCIFWLSF